MSDQGPLAGQTLLLTGGHGFLGSHIVDRLAATPLRVARPHRADVDFVDQRAAFDYLDRLRPDLVIHTAAWYGGMRIHELHPARIYYENLMMGTNLLEAARRSGVKKFVTIGSDCAYPGYLPKDVLKEEDLWSGPPHETALDYGVVKRILSVQGWAYQKEYGFNAIFLIPTNMYGPRDTFEFESAHVVGALIRRFVEADAANAPTVEVWGTDRPVRNFLYVEDAAEGIVRALQRYDGTTPLNLTTSEGRSVRELAETIRELVGYRGEIVWNTARPDGQLKKVLDVSRMRQALDWEPQVTLREGLERTIAWYRGHKALADSKKKIHA